MAGTAFATLYRAYFKEVKGAWLHRPEAPRARWDLSLEDKPKEAWLERGAGQSGPASVAAVAGETPAVVVER